MVALPIVRRGVISTADARQGDRFARRCQYVYPPRQPDQVAMRLQDAPEEGMVSLDVDPPHLLAGDFLLVLDGIDDPRDGCAGKAEEEDFLTRPQVALCNLRGLQEDRKSG